MMLILFRLKSIHEASETWLIMITCDAPKKRGTTLAFRYQVDTSALWELLLKVTSDKKNPSKKSFPPVVLKVMRTENHIQNRFTAHATRTTACSDHVLAVSFRPSPPAP